MTTYTDYHDKTGAILTDAHFENEPSEPVKFIAYINGAIRTPAGKLVAYYFKDTGQLVVDGHIEDFAAGSLEEAMDLINLVWVE